tara:strand:+ start:4310 stop:4813 length:504 start_codon:yes stop_codon:yes gene_type:complete
MKYSLFILFCAIQSLAFSHDYFFAFAEVEYDDMSQQFESTIVISSHDLELILKEKELSIDSLSAMNEDSKLFDELERLLNKHFQISSKNSTAEFRLLGGELLLNGMVQLYTISEPIEISGGISVFFDLLMPRFSEQQNKITIYCRGKSYTATFMQTTKTNEIRFEYN